MSVLSKKSPEEMSTDEINAVIGNLYHSEQPLEPESVVDALSYCFTTTHRSMLLRRNPRRSIQDIDSLTKRLLGNVIEEEIIDPSLANKDSLKSLVLTLDERFGFAADPEISDQHQHVIFTIIDKMK